MKPRTLGLLLLLLATGCISANQIRRRSDLMSYLYPKGGAAVPVPLPQAARLQLPLRIGIAFVPAQDSVQRLYMEPLQFPTMKTQTVDRQNEEKLLEIVRKTFAGRDWVREIVVIPSSYLMPHGGFENLEQVAALYGVDVMALASVDQIQYVDRGKLSFLYLSIIGQYILPLERNDTRTLIDVAVFHVPTRTFLLRAPGQSMVKGHSTAVEEPRHLRDWSASGMRLAMNDLSKNLDEQVSAFKADLIAGARPNIDVVNRQGVSIRRSGSFGWAEAIASLLLTCAVVSLRIP